MAKRQGKPNKKSLPGRLRIVAGNWRSRLLEIADVEGLRPTPERIRETLFNWLSPDIAGKRCLDLFAGTGALGLEALSRGAAESVFVEISREALGTLRHNAALLDAAGASIVNSDALDYLASAGGQPFDVIFVDPPFAADMLGTVCEQLGRSGVVKRGSVIYLEGDVARALPDLPAGWAVTRERTTGNVRYALVTVSASQQEGEE